MDERSGRGRRKPAVGVIAIVSTIAAVLLNGRIAALLTAAVMLWTPAALFEAELGTLLVVGTGLAAAIHFALRQARLDRVAEHGRRQRERALTRAAEILSDYEQTGQGWFWETDRRGAITYVSATVGAVRRRAGREPDRQAVDRAVRARCAGRTASARSAFHLSARSSFQELAVRAALGRRGALVVDQRASDLRRVRQLRRVSAARAPI